MITKKLLILVLILGTASVANAMTLQISVNGNLDPVDSEIVLEVGETAVLNIHSPDGYSPYLDDVFFALVVDTTYGNISGGAVQIPPAPWESAIFGDDARANGMCSAPEDGIWGWIMDITGQPAPPGTYIDDVLFDCLAEGDAVINLYTTVNRQDFVLEESVIIHQIPEPATVLLLGMGIFGIGGSKRKV